MNSPGPARPGAQARRRSEADPAERECESRGAQCGHVSRVPGHRLHPGQPPRPQPQHGHCPVAGGEHEAEGYLAFSMCVILMIELILSRSNVILNVPMMNAIKIHFYICTICVIVSRSDPCPWFASDLSATTTLDLLYIIFRGNSFLFKNNRFRVHPVVSVW